MHVLRINNYQCMFLEAKIKAHLSKATSNMDRLTDLVSDTNLNNSNQIKLQKAFVVNYRYCMKVELERHTTNMRDN